MQVLNIPYNSLKHAVWILRAEQTLFSVPCRIFMWIIWVAAVVFYHQILCFLRAEKNVFPFLYDYRVCLPGKMP